MARGFPGRRVAWYLAGIMATTRPCEASPAGTTTGTRNLSTRFLCPVLPSGCYVAPEIGAAAWGHGVGDVVYQRACRAHSRACACVRHADARDRVTGRDAGDGADTSRDAGNRAIARAVGRRAGEAGDAARSLQLWNL